MSPPPSLAGSCSPNALWTPFREKVRLIAVRWAAQKNRHVLHRGLWHWRISDRAIQPPVLLLQSFELADLVHFQPHMLLRPPMERLLGHPDSSEQLRPR
jgi:hypothetical protein